MKKIALMTWHHVENYGTAFQALALKSILERMDCQVTLINYMRSANNPAKQISLFSYVTEFLKSKISTIGKKHEYTVPDDIFEPFFSVFFKYTKPCIYRQDLEELNSEFDGFVCGSDQIWSPRWFDRHFFLDFVQDNNRLISYAPSFGAHNIGRYGCSREISELVGRFNHISVREKSGCEEIKQLIGRDDVQNVLDPVLTIGSEFWETLIRDNDRNNNEEIPYMFIFFLKNSDKYIRNAIAEAKKQGLKPVIMHSTQSEDNSYSNIGAPDPIELLKIIENAQFVSTDSFHIMVFSILFHVQFMVYQKFPTGEMTDQNDRLTELLELLNIKNRVYGDNYVYSAKIDFEEVDAILENYRFESLSFLKNAIDCLPVSRGQLPDVQQCEKCEQCIGENREEFTRYINSHKNYKRFIDKHMLPWNFCLCEKCFGCKKMIYRNRKYNYSRPEFYDGIKDDLSNGILIFMLYWKYYSAYDIIFGVKKLFRKK